MNMSPISWEILDQIAQGHLARIMAPCPLCSANRKTAAKRNSKVLAVTLVEPDFAIYFCNHCGVSGWARPESSRNKPINPRLRGIAEQKELQRQREQADRFAFEEKKRRTHQALKIWDEGLLFHGSPAETYLQETRGIGEWLDSFAFLDHVFRYRPDCPFGEERWPCLLALVRDIRNDEPVGIHRTALTSDNPPKKMDRRSLGQIGGGAIKISPYFDVCTGLMIAEGIETVLSASKLFQFKPIWSLVDAGNLAKFPALSGIECVTIAVDNDSAGQKAANECAQRLLAGGIEVITARTNRVSDFNDLEVRRAGHALG
jgi:hypothetical protein